MVATVPMTPTRPFRVACTARRTAGCTTSTTGTPYRSLASRRTAALALLQAMTSIATGAHGPAGDAQGRMQDGAGRDADEDALLLQQLARPANRVGRTDREAGREHRGVVQLGDEALVDVAQAVDQLSVPGLRRDDL